MLEIYEKHAALLGFSVRKHTTRYFPGTKNVMEKYFVCCAQGKRNINRKKKVKKDRNDKEDEGKKKRKPRKVSITRTDCKACIRVKYNEEGLFEVIHHVIAHNHDLTRTQWNYLHRSQREITKEKGQAIESMQKSGLSAMDSYSYMCEEAGGEECVGHSVRDHLNYCTRLKMKTIEGGDATITYK
ncbi:Protein FAR1-RELATED SEQUENCE 5 [Bienertia sinuspersici]